MVLLQFWLSQVPHLNVVGRMKNVVVEVDLFQLQEAGEREDLVVVMMMRLWKRIQQKLSRYMYMYSFEITVMFILEHDMQLLHMPSLYSVNYYDMVQYLRMIYSLTTKIKCAN